MEKVIDCPICSDSDHCFEEEQEEYSSFMCFNCGFMSDTRFTKDNEGKLKSDSTILVNKLKTFDEKRGIWWFPSVVNMGKLGIIYPEGAEEKWEWRFAKTVPIPEDKKAALPNYESMLDTENASTYDRHDFLSACQDMGIAKDIEK